MCTLLGRLLPRGSQSKFKEPSPESWSSESKKSMTDLTDAAFWRAVGKKLTRSYANVKTILKTNGIVKRITFKDVVTLDGSSPAMNINCWHKPWSSVRRFVELAVDPKNLKTTDSFLLCNAEWTAPATQNVICNIKKHVHKLKLFGILSKSRLARNHQRFTLLAC